MNKRVKEIRKKLGLNQTKFAASLDIGQAAYSAIETGVARLTDKNINLICFKHRVNEEWLRYGKGEMFLNLSDDPNTDDEKKLIALFRRLVPEMKIFVLNKIRELVKNIEDSWIPSEKNNIVEKGEKLG